MPFSDINVGTVPNDGTGDSLKVAGEAINANFDKAIEGPVSSVDSNLVAFDGVTGKLVKDSGVASSAFATAAQGSLADTATQPGDDADTLGSGAATDGHVLTADGAGGAAWEAADTAGLLTGATAIVVLTETEYAALDPVVSTVLYVVKADPA